ncbi:NAD-dependent epimerase/dehydratase family protein [Poritiphilus flavus]|uniref:NAD-dependent epimerase/dehydratase family protein n=1 Tax=Poritiphilus flavus TaxID=2697053 RepID=A0A6L9EBG5_9FLAO|nr:NAD-dependent epimerase/dehydratase family protein [Poritiphilus flavus]NAS12034.1 NAD-dependent epimerase/dehydratase family protein [Poritiphilus flavus]
MQTILGSGGIIATELAKALKAYTDAIRLVSRNPEKVNPTDQLHLADLTKTDEVQKAVEGSEVVYVTIGFPYNAKVWKALWPPFIDDVISACEDHNSRLVFFDNIYMYDPAYLNDMTEETPIHPSSKKGKVRAIVANKILNAAAEGRIKALIARCADYYGPGVGKNGILRETVFKNLHQGKKANWLGSLQFKHSFTYTPDAGKATALLGNTEDAYNQVWHLPTASDPPTGKEWIERIAQALGVSPRYQLASRFTVRVLGLFVPIMKELVEMIYQYDRDYIFQSGKFESRFDFRPTPYEQGIREIVEADFKKVDYL